MKPLRPLELVQFKKPFQGIAVETLGAESDGRQILISRLFTGDLDMH